MNWTKPYWLRWMPDPWYERLTGVLDRIDARLESWERRLEARRKIKHFRVWAPFYAKVGRGYLRTKARQVLQYKEHMRPEVRDTIEQLAAGPDAEGKP